MGTDLITIGEDSAFLALRTDADSLTEMIRENVGPEGFSPADLDRINVPAGGATSWEVPTLTGEESVKTIEGVVVARGRRRAYWPDSYSGANDAPACSSHDGLVGIPNDELDEPGPGGECAACPFNEFGSAENGAGKACKEFLHVAVLPKDSIVPMVVKVPPASLKNGRDYFMALMKRMIDPTGIVTVLGLKKEESGSGIKYSQVTFAAGERLDPQAAAQMKAYSALVAPAFERAATEQAAEEGE
jgi:hypothetical protein